MSSVRGSYVWDMVRNKGHSKVSLLCLKADNVAEFGVRKGLKSWGRYMEIWRLQNGQSYSRCVRLYPDPSECSDMKKKMGEFTSFSVPRASSRSPLILLLSQAVDARQKDGDQTFPLLNPNQPWEFSFLCHCSCLFLHLTCSPSSTPASKLTQTSEPRTFPKSHFSFFETLKLVLWLCNSEGRFCLFCSPLCYSGPELNLRVNSHSVNTWMNK